jgi:coupling of ubiquitin conjugation to ER degradation protein 1
MAQTETSINIPQLLAVALVGFFAIRWYLNKPPPSSPGSSNGNSSNSSRANRGVDPAQIAQVSAMFPQLDRRSIAWDLHRNGGNVAGTSERILTGRGLDNPPPSYQPQLPEPVPAPGAAVSAARTSAGGQPDLITRYGLQGRIGDKGKEAVQTEEQKRSAWTSDKAARAEGLKRRREEMVLEARRKMLERDGRA